MTWVKGHATQEHVDWGITAPVQSPATTRGRARDGRVGGHHRALGGGRRAKTASPAVAVQRYMLDTPGRSSSKASSGMAGSPPRPARGSAGRADLRPRSPRRR